MFGESNTFCLRILSGENAATSAALAKALTASPPRRDRDRGDGQRHPEPGRRRKPRQHAGQLPLVDRLAPFVLSHQAVAQPEADVGARHHDQEGEAELPGEVMAEAREVVRAEMLLVAGDAP